VQQCAVRAFSARTTNRTDYEPDPTYYDTTSVAVATTTIVRPIATGVHVLERAVFFVPVTRGS
jgi:hypothetical protein